MLALSQLDIAITQFCNQLSNHSSLLDSSLVFITKFAIFFVALAVASLWWLRKSERARQRHTVALAGLSVTLGLLLNQIILLFIQRVRPYDAGVTNLLIQPSGDPSFPSDHATVVFALAFAFLFQRDWRGWPLLGAALLIAFSRVYVGTHYFSDVLGGAAIAFFATLFCHFFFQPTSKLSRWLTSIL